MEGRSFSGRGVESVVFLRVIRREIGGFLMRSPAVSGVQYKEPCLRIGVFLYELCRALCDGC